MPRLIAQLLKEKIPDDLRKRRGTMICVHCGKKVMDFNFCEECGWSRHMQVPAKRGKYPYKPTSCHGVMKPNELDNGWVCLKCGYENFIDIVPSEQEDGSWEMVNIKEGICEPSAKTLENGKVPVYIYTESELVVEEIDLKDVSKHLELQDGRRVHWMPFDPNTDELYCDDLWHPIGIKKTYDGRRRTRVDRDPLRPLEYPFAPIDPKVPIYVHLTRDI